MKIGRLLYDPPLSLREWAELLALIAFVVAILHSLETYSHLLSTT